MKKLHVKAMVKLTGEMVVDQDVTTPEEVMELWKYCSEYIKAFESVKTKLKALVPEIVNERGVYESNGYMFRYNTIQRMTYDKAALRNLIEDEDFFDTLVKPDKTLIDKLLKGDVRKGIEPDPRLWAVSHELREAMVPDGNPYQVVKLEKITADAPREA